MTPFPQRKYSIIYADPPWQYANKTHDPVKGADRDQPWDAKRQYPTMSKRDLAALPVASLAEADSLLFLWATGPTLDEAVDLVKAWGFAYKTIAFVWDKATPIPGNYTMSQCEVVLVGKRGRIPKPRGARNVRQLVSGGRGRHSAKPRTVRDHIDLMFPTQSKIELFARERFEGWDAWGNEV